jgi:hypothetical protein
MNFTPFSFFGNKVVSSLTGTTLYYDMNNTNSFSGGTTLFNLGSASSANQTLENGTTAVTGSSPNYLSFDGSNDYTVTSFSGASNSSYTMSCWVKMGNTGQTNTFFTRGSDFPNTGGLSGWSLQLYKTNTNRIGFAIVGGEGDFSDGIESTTNYFNTSSWYYTTGVYERTSTGYTISLYVNANLITSKSGNRFGFELRPPTNNTTGWGFGRITSSITYFLGQISQADVYASARTGTEILNNFNTTKSLYGY